MDVTFMRSRESSFTESLAVSNFNYTFAFQSTEKWDWVFCFDYQNGWVSKFILNFKSVQSRVEMTQLYNIVLLTKSSGTTLYKQGLKKSSRIKFKFYDFNVLNKNK